MSGQPILYFLLGVMVLFWSGNFIIAKIALREFPPLLLGGLRVALAGMLISPVYFWKHNRGGAIWTLSEVPILVCLGLFGVALNQLFFILGMSLTSVAHSSIIIGITPICVLLIAALVKQESITIVKLAGMAIALTGVAILSIFRSTNLPRSGGPTLLGDFFIFMAAVTFALFTVVGKRVAARHNAVTVNTFAYAGGALALSPVTIWYASHFSFSQVSSAAWASLVYMALFPSVICYLIYYHALTHIAASRVSAFSYLQPLLATVMAVALLGEHITPLLVAGGIVIFTGVYLTERRV